MTQVDLTQWIGRTTEIDDVASHAPMRMLAATLDRNLPDFAPGGMVPPLGHWMYFLPCERQSAIGEDGHPRRGGFLPPVDLPRRMWAGSQLTFHRDLRIGGSIRRISRIVDVSQKSGSTGALVFVKVGHEVHDGAGLAITQFHDIVYREAPAAGQLPLWTIPGGRWEIGDAGPPERAGVGGVL
jgi:3-methylfumaryl-CoA hydratase